MINRVLRTAKVTLTHLFEVDEVLTDASGTVTVSVKRLDGTTVQSGNATRPSLGTYTFELNGQANLDTLIIEWTGTFAGAAVIITDIVEIVGGYIFELSAGRKAHPSLSDTVKYPTSLLAERRTATEIECEWISGQAWVPRFYRCTLNGSGTDSLVLPHGLGPLRTVRSMNITDVGNVVSELSWDSEASVIYRSSGFPSGRSNVLVEFEYGHDAPRPDIRLAAMQRLRFHVAQSFGTGVPSRALSFTSNEGGTYRLTTAGPKSTGEPDVDAAYRRDERNSVWIA